MTLTPNQVTGHGVFDRVLPSSEWSWNQHLLQAVVEPAISRNMFVQKDSFPNFWGWTYIESVWNQHHLEIHCVLDAEKIDLDLLPLVHGQQTSAPPGMYWHVRQINVISNLYLRAIGPTMEIWLINSWLFYQVVNTKHHAHILALPEAFWTWHPELASKI